MIASFCPYNFFIFKFQFAVLIFCMLPQDYLMVSNLHYLAALTVASLSAPAFMQAGIYIILYAMVSLLGPDTSPLPKKITLKFYLIAFGCVDIICLTLQSIGGALAGAASGNGSTKTGTNIMVVGIIIQLVSTIIFSGILAKVIMNGRRTIRGNKHLIMLTCAAFLGVCLMITRGVYRSIELMQGWTGFLIIHERYAIVLDGAMMVLVSWTFNIVNPRKAVAAGKEVIEILVEEEKPVVGRKASEGGATEASSGMV